MWCKNKNCPIFRECDKSKEQWEICVETAGEKKGDVRRALASAIKGFEKLQEKAS